MANVKYRNVKGYSDPISQTGLIVVTRRPVMRYSRKKDAHGEALMICPICGHTDDKDGFDVIGADDGCLFCTQCNTEIAV